MPRCPYCNEYLFQMGTLDNGKWVPENLYLCRECTNRETCRTPIFEVVNNRVVRVEI